MSVKHPKRQYAVKTVKSEAIEPKMYIIHPIYSYE